jgi:4-hydroxy-L-threonine phosphate dehydrogenase PdxA
MLPRIGITAGDPAGIGPEIARKAMTDARVVAACEPLFYGPEHEFQPGALSAEAGYAAYETIVRAVRDAEAGGIDGIATAPINKEALALAGLPWRGHTEMLADLTHTKRVAMMFWSEKLRVVLATIHIPLAEVPAALTTDVVTAVIELTNRELPRSDSRARGSRWRGSTRTLASTACLGVRRPSRSSPLWLAAGRRRSTSSDLCPATRCSCARSGASSTPWLRAITIRA